MIAMKCNNILTLQYLFICDNNEVQYFSNITEKLFIYDNNEVQLCGNITI